MLSIEEKILLLDEVASTARSSWQMYLAAHAHFSTWPDENRQKPAYLGYRNLENLLSVSLMTACYSLVETGKRSYSLHHAVSDADLRVSSEVRMNSTNCFDLRSKIAKYRNNVVAHVNATRTQSDWAQAAGIVNSEIDDFLFNARAAVEGLSRDNLEGAFVPGVTRPVQGEFHAFCREIARLEPKR
ncbi:hypothetical protein [Ascidiaceihabitans sp.]|uniref:hypothetical protein n=1 Tax=Ascidiaceihabitans sp. TaxID=1872644 RepID=UPI00329845BC